MKISKKLQAFLEEAKKQDSYWVEKAKLDFALALEHRLREEELSYADLAKKVETSAPYITKVLRGDSNLTIESMVKFARAAGGNLDIRIQDRKASTAGQWDITKFQRRPRLHLIVSNTVTTMNPVSPAANHHAYQTSAEAAA
jgi:transcriptional regulator with XRE-family HTH domain